MATELQLVINSQSTNLCQGTRMSTELHLDKMTIEEKLQLVDELWLSMSPELESLDLSYMATRIVSFTTIFGGYCSIRSHTLFSTDIMVIG